MKKFIYSVLAVVALTVSVYSQSISKDVLTSLQEGTTLGKVNVEAQGNEFYISSSANYYAYLDSPFQRVIGFNSFVTLTPKGSYTFPTTGGGSYNCNLTSCGQYGAFSSCDCGGISVFVAYPSINAGFLKIVYASPTQINGIWRQFPNSTTSSSTAWHMYKPSGGGGYTGEASHVFFPTEVQPKNAHTFLEYTTLGGVYAGYVKGTLYGYLPDGINYVALKSLTDGTANPRTYNGYNTFMQVYVTGVGKDPSTITVPENLRFQYDAFSSPLYYQTQTMVEVGEGLFVTNLFPQFNTGGNWGAAGHHDIKLAYGNAVSWQDTAITGKIWFN